VVVDLFAKIWRASNFVGNMFEEMRGKSYQVRVGYHQRFYTHIVTVNKIKIFDYLNEIFFFDNAFLSELI
jgi:hypothetical protein